jgi:hypothetical protein
MIRLDELEAQAQPQGAARSFMPETYMDVGHQIDSHRFWDVAELWSQEMLRHHSLMVRALAKAVVRDGLRLQSHVPAHIANDAQFCWGGELVGYVSRPGQPPSLLRTVALRHLEAIVEKAAAPDRERLREEYVLKIDFRQWLLAQGLPLPTFWFSPAERHRVSGFVKPSFSP